MVLRHHQARRFWPFATNTPTSAARKSSPVEDEIDVGGPDSGRGHGGHADPLWLHQARAPADTYRAQKRGGKGVTGHDHPRGGLTSSSIFVTSTHARTAVLHHPRPGVSSSRCYEIPEAGRTAKGTAIVNLLQLDGGEKVTAVHPRATKTEGGNLVMATKNGVIKKHCAFRIFEHARQRPDRHRRCARTTS